MSVSRVIMVEDEPDLASEIAFNLRDEDIDVVICHSGEQLDRFMAKTHFDIVVLDVGLPGEDGFSIATRLANRDDLRLIMLTARADVEDRLRGINAGADAYLTKPVDVRELAAVIKRLQHRIALQRPQWRLDPLLRRLHAPADAVINLSEKECEFLDLLRKADAQRMTREDIVTSLWPAAERHDTRRLEVMIHRLREKTAEQSDDEPLPLRTLRGYGYQFSEPLQLKVE